MATKTRELADFILEEGIGGDADIAIQSKPHIIPGVLYPAVGGKLLDGFTSHSGNYGTAQTQSGGDGRKYYYTDIKGSKPIKDPRIGAHFGSQRHKFGSVQLLEQETATNGSDVYSVDGREWLRLSGTAGTGWNFQNNSNGINFHMGAGAGGDYIEITGYFNGLNIIVNTEASRGSLIPRVNGTDGTGVDVFEAAVATPLSGRYVGSGSVSNVTFSQGISLGINTVRLTLAAANGAGVFGIELIVQDTTSTATKSQIQIPSQNVVSYGKKFTVSGTPHYNPFAFAGDGTTAVAIGNTTSHGKVADGWTGSTATYFDSTLDTATSLGLSAWETGGDFYRPVNGGRVVRWVDSSGNIKTSVNMMPPCATAVTAGSDASLPTSHAWTTVYQPKIKSGAIDPSQAEVAKTFHFREFGNGAANGGTLSGTYADASMLSATDDIAYVMDDGLTSLVGNNANINTNTFAVDGNTDSESYITFIGTGIGYHSPLASGSYNSLNDDVIAQNLPYGTHVIRNGRNSGGTLNNVDVDGVEVFDDNSAIQGIENINIFQPKMPPIPKDAVVIADYMLMADFVPRTANGIEYISKGVRYMNPTRDYHYNYSGSAEASSGGWVVVPTYRAGFSRWDRNHNSDSVRTVTCFGNSFDYQYYGESSGVASTTLTGGSAGTTNMSNYTLAGAGAGFTSVTSAGVITKALSGSEMDNYVTGVAGASAPIGVQVFKETSSINSMTNYATSWAVHTPIHTSSHYQTFETPFLHELVGGDRNMEQTNLVVTPDGKTWDEVTRDVSYIGPKYSLTCSCPDGGSSGGATSSTAVSGSLNSIYTNKRGTHDNIAMHNKGIALAYNYFIPLYNGFYEISVTARGLNGTQLGIGIQLNDTDVRYHWAYTNNNDHGGMDWSDTYYMERGQRWNVKIVSGTFRIQYESANLLQVKYLGGR